MSKLRQWSEFSQFYIDTYQTRCEKCGDLAIGNYYNKEWDEVYLCKNCKDILEKGRYVFDKKEMIIFDKLSNKTVCLVSTKRPDLLESKLNELLCLANRIE